MSGDQLIRNDTQFLRWNIIGACTQVNASVGIDTRQNEENSCEKRERKNA
jgi:hypothetical protein